MFNGLCHFGNWGSFGAWGWAAMILQLVLWLSLIAGIVLLIVWAVRRSGRTPTALSSYATSSQPSAKDILQARYARGEITREQYQQMLRDLS